MNSVLPLEPSPERLAAPIPRYVLATRPAFLTITLVGVLLGLATAPVFHAATALATLVLALLAHAGVNVCNDYYDHLNGTDARNAERLFPFTGGSRFIQNGVLTPRQTLSFAVLLFGVVIAGGLWLIHGAGMGLFWIGLAGLGIGWAYSATPFRLNSRGLGELCVLLGFLLIVVGADYTQRGAFAMTPWLAGLPYALLTTNILYINQFPDRRADLAAGKHHWVARLAPERAAWGYVFILLAAAAWSVAMVAAGALPMSSLLALPALLPGILAARRLLRHASEPARLAPAIRATLATAHLYTLLSALFIFWARG